VKSGLVSKTTKVPVLVSTRETREGWPLLTVGTEVNGDSKSIHILYEQDPSFGWFTGLVVLVQEIFSPALAALVGPVQFFFSRQTLFQFICLHLPASWASSRAGSPVS
jgi:hypothetical protein